jgi:NAD(P)-dependent dehydrogenase (short-subunit alcohol dehydrogenase family)
MTTTWTPDSIPDLSGRRMIITGGNSGIGWEAAKVLAGKGASIILAVRSVEKGNDAAQQIRDAHPTADVEVMPLDLADLASVRAFAGAYQGRYNALDVLINNAGVMALPQRKTADGFEMQFGTNHLGHFALTGLLLPTILATPKARVVTVSSGAHRFGKMNFNDLQSEKRYDKWSVYGQSKLSNLLFAYELQRRFEAAHADAADRNHPISVGVHPGYVATNLQAAGPRMAGSRVQEMLMGWGNRIFAGTAAQGAIPTIYAATSPEVNGCDYIGPLGKGKKHSIPAKEHSTDRSYNVEDASRLWEVSENLTGVTYTFATPQPT